MIFEGGGFKVEGPEATSFDCRIRIKTNGTPLGETYGKNYLYSGAKIKGNITCMVQQRLVYSNGFEWSQPAPRMIFSMSQKSFDEKVNRLKHSENAPFIEIFEKEFHLLLGSMIYTL